MVTEVQTATRTVTARPWLNVRTAPNLSSGKIGRLLPGKRVQVFDEVQGDAFRWLMIGFEGGLAFVAKKWTSAFRFEAWPTEFPFVITQAFGVNPDNYRQFYGDDRGHQGIDLRAPAGTGVFAVAPGIVSSAYLDPRPKRQGGHNFGIHCRLIHEDGYETIYAHKQELAVETGDEVAAGELLGLADNTGHSFGHHLHLHLKHLGRVIDPTPFVDQLRFMLSGLSLDEEEE